MKLSDVTVNECRRVISSQLKRLEKDTWSIIIPTCRQQIDTLHHSSHFHARPELFIGISGQSIFSLPHGKIVNPKGSMCIIPHGLPHTEKARDGNEPFRNLVIYSDQNRLAMHFSFRDKSGYPSIESHVHYRMNGTDRFKDLLEETVRQHAMVNSTVARAAVRGLLTATCAILLETMDGAAISGQIHAPSRKIMRCRHIAARDLNNPDLNVSRLARQLQCNADYLSHLFRVQTGMSLTAWINEQRIAMARELLETSDMNISQIAYACGYTDPVYFTRRFKRSLDMTPGQYRKRFA